MTTITDAAKSYIEAHKLSWSDSTLKSETARIKVLVDLMENGASPEAVYETLAKKYAPYSLVTYWTRAVALYQHYLDMTSTGGVNIYEHYRKTHGRLFKHKYQPRKVDVSFEQAKTYIESIQDPQTREACARALFGGTRIHEIHEISGGMVKGKGGKFRPYFGPTPTKDLQKSVAQKVRMALRPIGLTPHDLRRLFATKLVDSGLKEADLLHIMGWNSILTARSYLQPKNNNELSNIIGGFRA